MLGSWSEALRRALDSYISVAGGVPGIVSCIFLSLSPLFLIPKLDFTLRFLQDFLVASFKLEK